MHGVRHTVILLIRVMQTVVYIGILDEILRVLNNFVQIFGLLDAPKSVVARLEYFLHLGNRALMDGILFVPLEERCEGLNQT